MLESMLGPETKAKIMGKVMAFAYAFMAFTGMALIVISSVNPLFHAHFWPAIVVVLCGGLSLGVKSKAVRIIFAVVGLVAALWVLLNVMGKWIEPEVVGIGDYLAGEKGLPELMAPVLLMLAGLGGLLGAFGALAGLYGALKY
jgi:hypothetical protein